MDRRLVWKGAKAGAVTGLILGGFIVPSLAVVETLPFFLHYGAIMSTLPSTASRYLFGGMILVGAMTVIPAALILSLIGALFAVVRKWIPGASVTLQSITFFLLLWAVLFAIGVPTYLVRALPALQLFGFTLLWDFLFALVFAYLFRQFSIAKANTKPRVQS